MAAAGLAGGPGDGGGGPGPVLAGNTDRGGPVWGALAALSSPFMSLGVGSRTPLMVLGLAEPDVLGSCLSDEELLEDEFEVVSGLTLPADDDELCTVRRKRWIVS